jgi:hypothetical protein
MPVLQGQQHQRDKGDDTSAMAHSCKLDGGNNAGETMVTMPMQCEGTEGQRNKDNNTGATRATMPVQCWQWHQCKEGNDIIMTMAKMPAHQ